MKQARRPIRHSSRRICLGSGAANPRLSHRDIRQVMADPLVKVKADIEQFGWHCLHVYPRVGEDGIGFTYTIGLFASYGHPEIIIFGLSKETSHAILNDCAEAIKGGARYAVGEPISNVVGGNVRVYFRPVLANQFSIFGTASRYYGAVPFTAVVLFWPDKQGLFPWEPSSQCASSQAEGLSVV